MRIQRGQIILKNIHVINVGIPVNKNWQNKIVSFIKRIKLALKGNENIRCFYKRKKRTVSKYFKTKIKEM